jgi:ABC-type Na+ transport system ATPase subunit NatA
MRSLPRIFSPLGVPSGNRDAVTGLLRPSAGDARLLGVSVSRNPDEARALIGVCQQFEVLWPELTALEHLRIFGVLKNLAWRRPIDREAYRLLTAVQLTEAADRPTAELSVPSPQQQTKKKKRKIPGCALLVERLANASAAPAG